MDPVLLEIEEGERRAKTKKKGYLLAAILAVIFVVLAIVGISTRVDERRALAKETESLAVPTVAVVHPQLEPPQQELVLPSTLEAFVESPIFARTNGYLGHRYKDIGSRVRRGELLGDIETPEIDQELMQARAARDQAEAQLKLAQSSAKRWENLQKMDAVSQQETDERSSSYAQGEANLAAATANVRRLEQLESFKHIYAPFAGVVTRRNVDVGALINAGNSGSNQELFVVAQVDPIRIYVDVPEVYSPSIHTGVHGDITIPQLAGEHFTGSVIRNAQALDPATRTLRTEIDVPNPKGRLLPGSYAQVHFALKEQVQRTTLPVNALLFRAEGPRAAVVDANNKVQLKPVVIGRDFGTTVEILSGVGPDESIVLSPSDSLENGQRVQVAQGAEQR
jgi:multidrug efflux system membrane fusion protein